MFRIIKDNLLISILIGILLSAISFVILITTSYQYKATAKVLIVQDQLGTQDFYSLTKSAEYLANILTEAVYSTTFINVVKDDGVIDPAFFPNDKKEALKKWKKHIDLERSSNLGIIKVTVLDDSQKEAREIADGIASVLQHKNYLFRGKTNVDVRILSSTLVEKNPDLKTIFMVVFGSFVLGFMLAVITFYYRGVYKNKRLISGTNLYL